jgi:uncharacterized protein YcbX
MPEIASIYRYPVKGLSPDPLKSVRVAAGETLPFDRAWAIENGPSKFDPALPRHLPKIAFLMLMRNERLAALQTSFDESARRLTIRRNGEVVAEGCLETDEGRAALAAFFDAYEADELRGAARIVSAPGHAFTDTAQKCLSLVNLETVRHIEKTIGAPVHPMRFRGNLYVEGLPAWAEFDAWLGKTIRAGDVVLEAYARIDRCAATNVNPETAERDLTLPLSLLQTYGHPDCGIYMRVIAGGELAAGMVIGPA